VELVHLQTIVEGLDSLAAIEREHPALGAQLFKFVNDVSECCGQAYSRLDTALATVRSLPSRPSSHDIDAVLRTLADVPNSQWFRDVTGICDRLAGLATGFGPAITKQIRYTSPFGDHWADSSAHPDAPRYAAHYKIAPLLSLLEQHERELKDDLRKAVATLQTKLGPAKDTQNVEDARRYALDVHGEITRSLDEIRKLAIQIQAGSSQGASVILSAADIAEGALRRPERVLLLNMFFLITVVAAGAAAFQFVRAYQFVLITSFALTAVLVVNAFYLRTIDKLKEENFLKLIQLALLKFFAPLTRRKEK